MKQIFTMIQSAQKSQRGDTLVEVLISLAILALVLATAYISSSHSLRLGTEAGNRTQALSYAQKQVELIKDAYAAPDAGDVNSRYQNYVNQDFNTNSHGWFCIKDTGDKVAAVNDTQTCATDVLNQGIGNQYQVGDFFDFDNNQFNVKSLWPGAASGAQQQLTLHYRPAAPRPKVAVTLEVNPPSIQVNSNHHYGEVSIHWTARNAQHCTAGFLPSNLAFLTFSGSRDSDLVNGSADKSEYPAPSGDLIQSPPLTRPLPTVSFTINCLNDDGSSANASDTLQFTPPDPPEVHLYLDDVEADKSGTWGQSVPNLRTTIRWLVTGTDLAGCTASGESGWYSGGFQGSQILTFSSLADLRPHNYSLECRNSWDGENGYNGRRSATRIYTVNPEPLVPQLQLWDVFKDNREPCSSNFGWTWLCGASNSGHVWQVDSGASGDGFPGDGGWRPHRNGGNRFSFDECTNSHVWGGDQAYSQYTDPSTGDFYLTDQDDSHRWRSCGGFWYAAPNQAGIPGVACEMFTSGYTLWQGGPTWRGGLPIGGMSGRAFFFPGVGEGKVRQPYPQPGQMDTTHGNLQLHCTDNGGAGGATRTALACLPYPGDCTNYNLPQRLQCHIGSPSGPDSAGYVYEGSPIVVTLFATGGDGYNVWNLDDYPVHANRAYVQGPVTYTFGRPNGNGMIHYIYLDGRDLQHADNGVFSDYSNSDKPSCEVSISNT